MAFRIFKPKKYHLGMTGDEVKEALQSGGGSSIIVDLDSNANLRTFLLLLQSNTTGGKIVTVPSEYLEFFNDLLLPLCNALKSNINTQIIFKIPNNGGYAAMTSRKYDTINDILEFSFTYNSIYNFTKFKRVSYTIELEFTSDIITTVSIACYTELVECSST